MATNLRERLIDLIEPVVDGLGYELVDVEHVAGRQNGVLRVFIDRVGADRPDEGAPETGVTVDDCANVSRAVSELLDVEDPVPGAYSLEISSPGFDRVLRKPAHFERFVGGNVQVELKAPREGRRRYTGRLDAVSGDGVRLEVDRRAVELRFDEIGKARLAP